MLAVGKPSVRPRAWPWTTVPRRRWLRPRRRAALATAPSAISARMRATLPLALVLFAHCDRAWSALQPPRPPSADGFRVAYFGYGSNLAASVREGRRGLRPLSCEVRSHPLTCLPQLRLSNASSKPTHQAGFVRDERLAFNMPGFSPIEPAFASIVPSKGDECHGAVSDC